MTPVIRIDDDVWGWLKSHARPLEDTPNSVLRRLAGFNTTENLGDTASRTAALGEIEKPRQKKGHHNARLILGHFVEQLRNALAARQGSVRSWVGGHRSSKNLVELTAPSGRTLLYVKVSDVHGFWGLNPNQLRSLRAAGAPWAVVLLLGPGEDAYLLPAADVVNALDAKKWSVAAGGEYKINIGPDLRDSKRFSSYAPLVEAVGRLNKPRAA